ncbi:hypothetical protein ACS0TY_005965 [Phlomoides rotata]
MGEGAVLRGMLWYQDEADTLNDENARLYKTRFQQFVNGIRGDMESPLLPVIEIYYFDLKEE